MKTWFTYMPYILVLFACSKYILLLNMDLVFLMLVMFLSNSELYLEKLFLALRHQKLSIKLKSLYIRGELIIGSLSRTRYGLGSLLNSPYEPSLWWYFYNFYFLILLFSHLFSITLGVWCYLICRRTSR
jgi:hypothetical protein